MDLKKQVFFQLLIIKKRQLIPIVVKIVITQSEIINRLDLRTRIYSDCFSGYRETDFERLGYLLHRVNHSIWLGMGLLHKILLKGFGHA